MQGCQLLTPMAKSSPCLGVAVTVGVWERDSFQPSVSGALLSVVVSLGFVVVCLLVKRPRCPVVGWVLWASGGVHSAGVGVASVASLKPPDFKSTMAPRFPRLAFKTGSSDG